MARGKRESLTASVSVVRGGDVEASKARTRILSPPSRDSEWQEEAFAAYNCTADDTEILTVDGWRSHDALDVGDLVLTLDVGTGLAGWEPVEAIHRFDVVDVPMLAMRSQRHSSLTTLSHRWPTLAKRYGYGDRAPHWSTSADLLRRSIDTDLLRTAAPCRDVPVEAKWSDALVEIVAWIWTEGTWIRGGGLSISQSASVNAPHVASIRAALTALLGPPTPRDDPRALWHASRAGTAAWAEIPRTRRPDGMVDFRLNRPAAEPFRAIIDEDRAVALDFIHALTRAQLTLFIAVSIAADGFRLSGRTGRTAHLAQAKRRRLDAFDLACILAGRDVVSQVPVPHGMWRSSVRDYAATKVSDRRVIPWTGTVWCPQTPSGTWFARRDGTTYFTGNSVGEVRFAARTIANALSRVRFYVGRVPDPGQAIAPIDTEEKGDDGVARDVLDRLKGRDGSVASLVRDYGIQQFLVGESYLVGKDGVVGEQWEMLSVLEWRRIERNRASIQTSPDAAAPPPSGALVLRLWQRAPQDRSRADSSLRPVLAVCDALRTAQQMQTAGDRSRIATNGIYWLPAEAELPTHTVQDANGVEQPRLNLIDDLLDVATTSMADPGSAAAAVPIVATMKSDMIEKAKHETFDRKVDDTIVQRIDHLIRRLAQGLDLVPEKLLGVGDVSHWTAWSISEDTVTSHVAPLCVSLCEDLTVGFVRPMLAGLKAQGDFGGDPTQYAMWFDVTDIVVSPNRASHAQWGFEHYLLDGETTIEALGFSDDQMPTVAEINMRVAIAQAATGHPITPVLKPATSSPDERVGVPVVAPPPPVAVKPPAPPVGEETPPPGETPNDAPPASGPPKGVTDPTNQKKGKPTTQPSGDAPPAAPANRRKGGRAKARSGEAALVVGAATMAVDRALERAGARLRTCARASKVEAMAAAAEAPDPTVLPAIIGEANVIRCGTTTDDLMANAWDGFAAHVAAWVTDAVVAAEIIAGVDRITRSRLYDPRVDVIDEVDALVDQVLGDDEHDRSAAELVGAPA